MSSMHRFISSSPFRRVRVHASRVVDAPAIAGPSLLTGDGQVAVRGLLCGLCAARTESALRSVAGVESARVDLHTAQATLHLSPGASVSREELQHALDGVVIAMPARRALASVAALFRRAYQGGEVPR